MTKDKKEKTKEQQDQELEDILRGLEKDSHERETRPDERSQPQQASENSEKERVNAQFMKAAQDAKLEQQKLAAIQAQQTQQPIAVHQVIDPNKSNEETRKELLPIVSAFLEYCKNYPKPENNNKDDRPRLEGNAMYFPKETDAEDFFKGQAAKEEFLVKTIGRAPEIYMHGDGKGGFFKGNKEELDNYLKNKKDNTSNFVPTKK
ncbi:MAG: hypothetical protein WC627_09900 [Legionella sp.]|jgi:hypothetical protein